MKKDISVKEFLDTGIECISEMFRIGRLDRQHIDVLASYSAMLSEKLFSEKELSESESEIMEAIAMLEAEKEM